MGIDMEANNDFERYQKAKKQVKELKGFYGHLLSYVFVMIVIICVNLKYTPEVLWFIWTLLGWGIGLFFHAMRVFDFFPFFNKDWEQNKIQKFMKEEMSNQKKYHKDELRK